MFFKLLFAFVLSYTCFGGYQADFSSSTSPLWSDTTFIDIKKLDKSFVLDIRYATTNNFTKQVLYPCAKAYLRKKVALALVKANQYFKKKGYRIKVFDAYRPLSVQWKLWKMYENPDYVADPRKGSMHNRGAAVDLTLVDKSGKELDMGTEFDFFGEKAHHAYTQFPKQVLANRELLKTGMRLAGFSEIKTEWWHYSYTSEPFNLSDMPFDCK